MQLFIYLQLMLSYCNRTLQWLTFAFRAWSHPSAQMFSSYPSWEWLKTILKCGTRTVSTAFQCFLAEFDEFDSMTLVSFLFLDHFRFEVNITKSLPLGFLQSNIPAAVQCATGNNVTLNLRSFSRTEESTIVTKTVVLSLLMYIWIESKWYLSSASDLTTRAIEHRAICKHSTTSY